MNLISNTPSFNKTISKPSGLGRAELGLSLFITLIALAVMSLAAVGLIRSVDTNSIIAGNLAFKQTATASADAGVEAAITWLQANNNGVSLNNPNTAAGYSASVTNSDADPVGSAYWDSLSANICLLPLVGGACAAAATADVSGNTSAFMIQRLCVSNGASTGAQCIVAAGGSATEGNNEGAGEQTLTFSTQVYYRVIVKVTGPRNTTSYVQTIISL